MLKTNNVDHHRTADFPALAAALRGKPDATASMADVFTAPAILLIGNDPTEQHPLLAWQIRNNVRLHRAKLYVINSESIKLRRQATSFTQIPAGTEGKVVAFLAGDDAALETCHRFGRIVQPERHAFALRTAGQTSRRTESRCHLRLGDPRQRHRQPRFIWLGNAGCEVCLSRPTIRIRGARPTWVCIRICCRAITRSPEAVSSRPSGARFRRLAGLDLAGDGRCREGREVESSICGRIESDRARGRIDPFAFSNSFVVVQDMFLTETAVMADVVLPAANAYEKSGSVTNTCGDVQLVKKAGEVSGTKPDFEMIVRIADAMGADVRKLVPFGGGVRADMGQSRGAQSGEADRHSVWLEMQGLEPKLEPVRSHGDSG